MLTIAEVADRIGEHICEQTALQTEIKKVCFGIEIILIMSIFISTTLIIGGLAGLFLETVIILAATMLIKFMLGGSHTSGFLPCLIYSISLVIISAGLSHFYPLWLSPPAVLSLMILNLSILIFFPLLPSYRAFGLKQIFTRKFIAGAMVILSSLLYLNQANFFCASLINGFSMAIITFSPIGTYFTAWFEKIASRIKVKKGRR